MLSPPTSRLPSTQSMPFGVASSRIEPNEQQEKVELKAAYDKLDKYMDQFEKLEARLQTMELQKDQIQEVKGENDKLKEEIR